jgi:predicted DNA-binding transcriptional regulator AlpA
MRRLLLDPVWLYEPAPLGAEGIHSMNGKMAIGWHNGRAVYCDPVSGQPITFVLPESVPPKPADAPVAPLPAAAQAVLAKNPDLTREEAARFLGITPATLSDWASKKRGPPYTDLGQAVKYPLAALVEWKAQQMKNAAPATEPEPVKRGRGRPRRVPV